MWWRALVPSAEADFFALPPDELRQLVALLDSALKALRVAEWGGTVPDLLGGWASCPICGREAKDGMHAPDCLLKQALDALEGREGQGQQ